MSDSVRTPESPTSMFARMQSTDRRLILGIMEILRSAGFSDTDVLLGYAMIHTYLFGRYQVVTRADWDVPEEVDATLARLLPLIPQLRGKDFFKFGVDTIIDGLHAKLAATNPSPTSRREQLGRELSRLSFSTRFSSPRDDRGC